LFSEFDWEGRREQVTRQISKERSFAKPERHECIYRLQWKGKDLCSKERKEDERKRQLHAALYEAWNGCAHHLSAFLYHALANVSTLLPKHNCCPPERLIKA
jgi:hypothetical protein